MLTFEVRDEIRALGQLGPVTFRTLQRIFREEFRRFPVLGHEDTSDDLATEFLTDRIDAYVMALGATHNDDAAGALTRSWARHWLIDRVRDTPYGALRNRLEKRLERCDLFARSTVRHFWCLAGGPDEDLLATPEELRRIAARTAVRVHVSKLGNITIGSGGELEGLLQRLLQAAGRLHIGDITDVCADRFPGVLETGDAHLRGIAVDDTDLDTWFEAPSRDEPDEGDVEARARQLIEAFSPTQIATLLRLDDVRDVADALGVGRSSAYNAINDVRSRLLELAGDPGDVRAVLTTVIDIAMDEFGDVPSQSTDRPGDDSHAA